MAETWPPTSEEVWAWYRSHPEWAEEDKRAIEEIRAGKGMTLDELRDYLARPPEAWGAE